MVILKRSIRVKEQILLPNGDRITANIDVEANLPALIKLQNNVMAEAQKWTREPGDEQLQAAFYEAYRALLNKVLGAGNLKRALDAYDGQISEVCAQLDPWFGAEVTPKIREASEKRVRKRKESADRTLRKMRRKQR